MDDEYVFKPDGIHECEPKLWKLSQIFKNVTVEILEDSEGNTSIAWYRQHNTEELESPDEIEGYNN